MAATLLLPLAVPHTLTVGVPVGVKLKVAVELAVAQALVVREGEGEPEKLRVGVTLVQPVGLWEPLREALEQPEAECVPLGV